MLVDDRLEEIAQHLFGDVEIGDHAILEWPNGGNPLGGAAEHPFRFEANPFYAAGRLLDRDDGGFVEHDPFTFDIYQRIRGAEVDGNFVGRKE